MSKRKRKHAQGHQRTGRSTSPTSYVLKNLEHFSFLDFCATFTDTLKDKKDSECVLKKVLRIIKDSKSVNKDQKDKADTILNDIEVIVEDDRVSNLFNIKKLKRAAAEKTTEEYIFTQGVGSNMLRQAGSSSTKSALSFAESSTCSEFHPRESTPSSDATRERPTTDIFSNTKMDYLVSANASDTIDISALSKKWILKSGYDFSDAFLKKRNQLVDSSFNNGTILSEEEELAINGVVLLDDDLQSNMVDEDVYEEACQDMDERYRQYEETEETYSHCVMQFAKLMSKGRYCKAEEAINESSVPSHVKATLYSLKRTYGVGYNTETLNESTGVKDGILPFLDNLFPNCKKYTTYGADKGIEDSRKRFIEMDPSLQDHVRKADFSVVSNRSSHLILAVESKSERTRNKSKGDVTKMARYMKDTIDSIQRHGFQQVPIAGLITSGACCSVYIMSHQHDYLYTMFRQGRFYMPLNHHDMFRIGSIFSILQHLKKILEPTIHELSLLKDNKGPENLMALKHLKTYHTPIKTQGERIKKVNLSSLGIQHASRKLQFE
ncbi:uncharacterized protein ATC70_011029 [Mucor velutinosus]|uniref:Uncharacterized protein n=1 Tax=Mucor velutinosus TaxID=708070 RepID=A0AAN7I0C3_9FUNG|nr:hypothetical protein ATC70_011029 [Mucor velutinosus]